MDSRREIGGVKSGWTSDRALARGITTRKVRMSWAIVLAAGQDNSVII